MTNPQNPEELLQRAAVRQRASAQTARDVQASPLLSAEQKRALNDVHMRAELVRKKNEIRLISGHVTSVLLSRVDQGDPDAAPNLRLHDGGKERRGFWNGAKIKAPKLGRVIGAGWRLQETPAKTDSSPNDRNVWESSYTPARGVCLLTDGDLGTYMFPAPEVALNLRYNLATSDDIVDFPPVRGATQEGWIDPATQESMAFPLGIVVMKNHVKVIDNLFRLEHLLVDFAESKGIA